MITKNHEKATTTRSLCRNSTSQPLYQGAGKPEENEAKKSCLVECKVAGSSVGGDVAFSSSLGIKVEITLFLFLLVGL